MMWKRKEKNEQPKPSSFSIGVDKLRAFRDIGETFNYRDIEMIVEGHFVVYPYVGGVAQITAAYKNHEGELKRVEFGVPALPALIAENIKE